MSARRLLLPAAIALFALTACGETATPGSGSTAPATPSVTTEAAGGVQSAGCPSETELQKLVELPMGLAFGGIECVKGWAGAVLQGSRAADGFYLFHYTAGPGWRFYGEGSGYECKELGLTEPAPFCTSD